jgi:S1-C subfamily serine protease
VSISRRWWSSPVFLVMAVPALTVPTLNGGAVAAAQPPADVVVAANQAEPAVARIDTTIGFQSAIGAGTGIVLNPNGEVLTNFHVVQGADSITSTVAGRRFDADLVGYDRTNDIALIQLRGAAGLPAARIGDAGSLTPGTPVVALGNAAGTNSPLTRESGSVVALGRDITAQDALTGGSEDLNDLIEFAAPVRAGDSGGPLANGAAEVVGVTTAAGQNFRMQSAGEGFAIPINRAAAIADQIRARIPSDTVHVGPPALLGVGISQGTPGADAGVVVAGLLVGGPAERAGIRNGDVITAVDGAPVDSANALTALLDRRAVGQTVTVTWRDATGQVRNGPATLTAG